MASKIGLTCGLVDGDGDFVPQTGLLSSSFKFILASDNVTEVTFSGFTEVGQGNYTFSGFDVASGTAYKKVRVKINDTFQDGFGIITVYRDDDEPTSKSYNDATYGRLASANAWTSTNSNTSAPTLTTGSTEYTTNTPAGDNSLIWKAYADSKYGRLASSNTWTGATNQFESALFHDFVTFEDVVTGQDYEMDSQSNLYLRVEEPANTTLVWKRWIIDNYGTGGTSGSGFPINSNRLVVDSKADSNVTGKIYQTISGAISYASSQTPSSTSKWTIMILPHHSSGYAEDITLVRFVNLVGLGSVVITGSFDIASAGAWTGYDARLENLVFSTNNESINLQQVKAVNCQFRANGSGGEVNLTFKGAECINCGFYVQNDVNVEITNPVKVNRIKGCYGNSDFAWLSTDVVYDYVFNTTDQWEF